MTVEQFVLAPSSLQNKRRNGRQTHHQGRMVQGKAQAVRPDRACWCWCRAGGLLESVRLLARAWTQNVEGARGVPLAWLQRVERGACIVRARRPGPFGSGFVRDSARACELAAILSSVSAGVFILRCSVYGPVQTMKGQVVSRCGWLRRWIYPWWLPTRAILQPTIIRAHRSARVHRRG